MSLDKSQESLIEVRRLAIDSILFALETNLEVISADYNQENGVFQVNTIGGSFHFKLVFPGEILSRGVGHA
jgi:hypothetical protein